MMKKFKGFTLVELLIVMGILAILMTIGISVGRFAIQRANNIQHQSAADQFGMAIQSYYTDNRRYPDDLTNGGAGDPDESGSALKPYIDASFDGGSPATFYYDTNSTKQSYLICVSYGGQKDFAKLGFYCTGDGFEDTEVFEGYIVNKEIEFSAAQEYTVFDGVTDPIHWDGGDWGVFE